MKTPILFFLFILSFVAPDQAFAQLLTVSGFVKNKITGNIKPNVAVFESTSGIGTITNNEGYYRLLLSPGNQKLEISSPGFKSYTSAFNLAADTVISVDLIPLNLINEKSDALKVTDIVPFAVSDTEKATGKLTKVTTPGLIQE